MKRMRARDRRRQLLEVATGLFAERGYGGTTTAELARAAGVTEPILYRHFKNKMDLFRTLIDEVGHLVIEAWEQALEGVEEPADRLRILLASNPATHERGRQAYRVIFHAMTELDSQPEVAEDLRQHLGRLHGFLSSEIAQLQKAGVVRDDEPADTLGWMLMDVAIGFGIIAPLGLSGRAAPTKAGTQRLLADLLGA